MEVYRGAVTHNRLQPTQHAFAYEVFSVCVDIDRLPAVSRQFWPFVSFDAVGCAVFRTSDHLHNHRKPGQSLSDAVRDFVHERTGWRPRGTIKLLTNLAYWGYNFNPVSFYFVYGDPPAAGGVGGSSSTTPPDRVEAIIAEVTNTPWGEQHCYVLHRSQAGVDMAEYNRATHSWVDMKADHAGGGLPAAPLPQRLAPAAGGDGAAALKPVVVESAAHAAALAAAGAAGVADYGALAAAFDAPIGSGDGGSGKTSSTAPAPVSAGESGTVAGPRRLRCRWDKSFHVSPFMSIDHSYDWIFTEPAETLLIQSQNRIANKPSAAAAGADGTPAASPAAPVAVAASTQPAPGTRMFNTQLRLTRLEDVTRWTWFYLLFIAFPFLTLRIQWWIHYEAFRLWWKGVPIYAHPGGTSNAFTRAVAAIMWPFFALAALFQTVDAGGGGDVAGSKKAA